MSCLKLNSTTETAVDVDTSVPKVVEKENIMQQYWFRHYQLLLVSHLFHNDCSPSCLSICTSALTLLRCSLGYYVIKYISSLL